MIVIAGLGVVSDYPFVQEDGANLAFLDEAVKVAIHRGKADSRQLLAHPPVDLIDIGMRGVTLERLEHLFQLTCRTFADSSPHNVLRIRATGWIRSHGPL
jgi:hypothetical protein